MLVEVINMPMPKKPTSLHLLHGNPSKIKDLGKNEPKPKPVAPKPPTWLDKEAKKEWKKIAPEMERLGLLTEIDQIAFANLCQEYSNLIKWQKVVSEHGATYEHTNVKGEKNIMTRPEAILLHKSKQLLKAYCAEFGMTASSRGRIQVPGQKDEEDEMETLLNKKSHK